MVTDAMLKKSKTKKDGSVNIYDLRKEIIVDLNKKKEEIPIKMQKITYWGEKMSKFKNQITSSGPSIPDFLLDKIEIRAIFALREQEAFLFSVALTGVSNQLIKEGYEKNQLARLTVLLTKDGTFELIEDENDVEEYPIGFRFNLAVYAVEKWREKEYSDQLILTVFIEELVHHYWNIEDEVITKEKVIEIMNSILNYEIEITDIFSAEWLNDYLIKQGKEPRF